MASVFLSYSRGDAGRIGCLAEALERAGHKVWWDRHIAGGQEFAGAIEQALEAADVVVVCWSKSSVRSAWVRDEAAAGRDKGRLVPLTLDGCLPPLGFRQYQTIDLSQWNGRATASALVPLTDAVAAKVNLAAGGTPATDEQPRKISQRRRDSSVLRWAIVVAAGLIVIAAGAFLYPRLWAGPGGTEPKVAVGEFALVSADLPTELPQMLSHEIVAAFGAENAVTVLAPGDRTRADSAPFVMNGSIGRVGDSVRFTVNLKNQRSGVVLWSDAFEHEAADAVAARQAAVGASQVVRCGLWGASSFKSRMSDDALSLYLKWCNEHWSGSGTETGELDAARRVTVALPRFSFGWSALALAAVPLAAADGPEANRLRDEATAAARKSISLDEQNPEGYMALAGLLPAKRYQEREDLLKKAISLRPTECGCERQAYGDFLAAVGRMEEAAEEYERARAMRPLAPFSNLRFAQALYVIGRNDEADKLLSETLQLWPDATSLQLLKIKSALWTRRYDDAIALLRLPDLPLTSDEREALTLAFGALRSDNAALKAGAASELMRFATNPRRNNRIVVGTLAALGAREQALGAAEDLMRTRGPLHAEVLFEPNLAAAKGEKNYAALVRRLGLVAYWGKARNAPDICGAAGPRPGFCMKA